jgi:hypothetical protein
MKRADITDEAVVSACREAYAAQYPRPSAFEILLRRFPAAHEKVVLRAMERTCDRGLIEYGVTITRAWPTDYVYKPQL